MNLSTNTSATRSALVVPGVVLAIAGIAPFMTGCQAIADIFKVGVGVGVFIVVAIVAVIGGIAMMVTKK